MKQALKTKFLDLKENQKQWIHKEIFKQIKKSYKKTPIEVLKDLEFCIPIFLVRNDTVVLHDEDFKNACVFREHKEKLCYVICQIGEKVKLDFYKLYVIFLSNAVKRCYPNYIHFPFFWQVLSITGFFEKVRKSQNEVIAKEEKKN